MTLGIYLPMISLTQMIYCCFLHHTETEISSLIRAVPEFHIFVCCNICLLVHLEIICGDHLQNFD